MDLLQKQKSDFTEDDINAINDIIAISNILYNNYPSNILPLEDGVYDLLLELCKYFNPNYMVGSIPVIFDNKDANNDAAIESDTIYPIAYMDMNKVSDFIFKDYIMPRKMYSEKDFYNQNTDEYHSDNHKILNTKHGYAELVGTLNKCKYVLNSQARDKGVFNDENVQIFERDFIDVDLKMGVINKIDKFTMALELKYDGVSVEADVSDMVHSARSRGDTGEDLAMDITPILYGYTFPHAVGAIEHDDIFGMKFEAIMTKDNLSIYNNMKNKNYKNCRTAIISIFNSIDGYKYRNLITLVPLATSLGIDRLTEIEFINKYYAAPIPLYNCIVTGNYMDILFQVKKFTEEAEYLRSFINFMFDGVVVSYIDDNIKKQLGRKNSVNLYSVAIKFNPLKKQTIFKGYDFTIGQDGTITPMIYYNPVEFYGTIHPKSSGHSYSRFMELQLRVGDIIDVEYTNDVMPYVTKPDNSNNANNVNPIIPFPETCPCCGTKLVISDSLKSAKCVNKECPERLANRAASTLKKLNIDGFSFESINKLGVYKLIDLVKLTKKDLLILGDANSDKFLVQMNKLMTVPTYDYKLIGAIGFEGIAQQKWKAILSQYNLSELISMYMICTSNGNMDEFGYMLGSVKGIGQATIDMIIDEFPYFLDDIIFISSLPNKINIKGQSQLKVRFSGFRDSALISLLNDLGMDAGEGTVTKDTNVLLVPSKNHKGDKVNNALKYGIEIMTPQEFMEKYNITVF